jgi:hypothetical protein
MPPVVRGGSTTATMETHRLRAVALTLAFVLPVTASAAERRESMLGMRAEPPVLGPTLPPSPDPEAPPPAEPAISEGPLPPPPTSDPVAAPTPSEPPAEVPPPVVDATAYREQDVDHDAVVRAESTRDLGASVMLSGGLVTVTGVILILAGFGATAAALRKDGCGDDTLCDDTQRKVTTAAKVTVAGLVISSLGSVTLISGVIVYGAGHSRLNRARRGSFDGFGLAPSQRGATIGLRGRF